MKNILGIFILLLFLSKSYGQNIFKISENSDLTILATIDSTFTKGKSYYARIKNLNSNELNYIKFEPKTIMARDRRYRYEIHLNDTVFICLNITKDTLKYQFSINENPKLIYNSIQVFKEKKKIKNDRKRLIKLKE